MSCDCGKAYNLLDLTPGPAKYHSSCYIPKRHRGFYRSQLDQLAVYDEVVREIKCHCKDSPDGHEIHGERSSSSSGSGSYHHHHHHRKRDNSRSKSSTWDGACPCFIDGHVEGDGDEYYRPEVNAEKLFNSRRTNEVYWPVEDSHFENLQSNMNCNGNLNIRQESRFEDFHLRLLNSHNLQMNEQEFRLNSNTNQEITHIRPFFYD